MNFEDLQNYLANRTQDQQDALLVLMLDNYRLAMDNVEAELNSVYSKILSGVKPENFYSEMLKYNRLDKLLQSIQIEYNKTSMKVYKDIIGSSGMTMANSYYYSQYALSWLPSDVNLSFTLLDPKIIELSITGTSVAWKEILNKLNDKYAMNINKIAPQYGSLSSLIYKNDVGNLTSIQQTMTQGFIQGWSVTDMGSNISDIFDTAKYQSERIARTENTRVASLGTQLSAIDAVHQGVQIKRQWSTTFDQATRPRHAALSGKLAPVGGTFPGGIQGPGLFGDPAEDINCRCSVLLIPVIDGKLDQPAFKRGRNPMTGDTEVYNASGFADWAAQYGLKQNIYGQYYN